MNVWSLLPRVVNCITAVSLELDWPYLIQIRYGFLHHLATHFLACSRSRSGRHFFLRSVISVGKGWHENLLEETWEETSLYFISPMGRPFTTTTVPQTVACYMESWPEKHSTECEDAEKIQTDQLSSRHSLFGCQEQLQCLTSWEWCLLATEVPVGVLFRNCLEHLGRKKVN